MVKINLGSISYFTKTSSQSKYDWKFIFPSSKFKEIEIEYYHQIRLFLNNHFISFSIWLKWVHLKRCHSGLWEVANIVWADVIRVSQSTGSIMSFGRTGKKWHWAWWMEHYSSMRIYPWQYTIYYSYKLYIISINTNSLVTVNLTTWPSYLWHGNPISGKDDLYIVTGPWCNRMIVTFTSEATLKVISGIGIKNPNKSYTIDCFLRITV